MSSSRGGRGGRPLPKAKPAFAFSFEDDSEEEQSRRSASSKGRIKPLTKAKPVLKSSDTEESDEDSGEEEVGPQMSSQGRGRPASTTKPRLESPDPEETEDDSEEEARPQFDPKSRDYDEDDDDDRRPSYSSVETDRGDDYPEPESSQLATMDRTPGLRRTRRMLQPSSDRELTTLDRSMKKLRMRARAEASADLFNRAIAVKSPINLKPPKPTNEDNMYDRHEILDGLRMTGSIMDDIYISK